MKVAGKAIMMTRARATEEAIFLFYFVYSRIIETFKEPKQYENEPANFSPSFGYK